MRQGRSAAADAGWVRAWLAVVSLGQLIASGRERDMLQDDQTEEVRPINVPTTWALPRETA